MQIYRAKTLKSDLARIPEDERTFYLLLGHVTNELNTLTKLFYWCSQSEPSQKSKTRAQNTQALVIGKVLVGKLAAAWDLMQQAFFNTKLSQVYEKEFSQETNQALDGLKKYFGRENLIRNVRNRFSFHYPIGDVKGAFDIAPENEEWEVYLAESNTNALYYTSDLVVNHALLEMIEPGNHQKAMDRLVEESTRVSGWFVDFIGGCMIVVTERYLLGRDGKLAIKTVDIGEVPSAHEVEIPYFVRTDPNAKQ